MYDFYTEINTKIKNDCNIVMRDHRIRIEMKKNDGEVRERVKS